MDGASDRLKRELDRIKLNPPKIPFISNVTADYVDDPNIIKENLALQVNHRTLWERSIRKMQQDEINDYYEIGPGRVLKGILRKIDKQLNVTNIEKPAEIYI